MTILIVLSSFAKAQDIKGKAEISNPQAQVVNITGSTEPQRQIETTNKVVVTRADIIRFGDTNMSDVLKRLPGVTVSGDVRMRGLGSGYTQILLNGDPVPAGFSIESISPELIERVELMRSATVEFSTQAIAGTINIVLKKVSRNRQREIKLGLVNDRAGTTPNVSLLLGDRAGNLSYNLTGVAKQDRISESAAGQVIGVGSDGMIDLRRDLQQQYRMRVRSFALTPRLNWMLANGDSIAWQSFVEFNKSMRDANTTEITNLGAPSDYPNNSWSSGTTGDTVRSDITWTHNGPTGSRLTTKLGLNHNKRETDYAYLGFKPTGGLGLNRNVDSASRDDQVTSSGKYSTPFLAGHNLVAGWDGSYTERSECRLQHDFDGVGKLLDDVNENYDAKVRRLAFYVQDEWDITPRWQMYLGLRWEGLYTDSLSNIDFPVNNRSGVWSPVLQTLWKIPGTKNDQVRLGITRSYKAPTTQSLIPRRYTANNDNGPTNPDRQGNPRLRPELAWGLDVAYEHYFSKAGMISASAFMRRIDDVTVERLYEENGVWIASPINDGKATVRGVELEAVLPLATLMPSMPQIDIKFNLSRNWSKLDSVPGPNNRLSQQTPFSANLGLDYRANSKLTVGGNYGFKSAGRVDISAFLSNYAAPTRTLDIYSVIKFFTSTQVRASAFNLLGQDRYSETFYGDSSGSTLRTARTASNRGVRVNLEHKF